MYKPVAWFEDSEKKEALPGFEPGSREDPIEEQVSNSESRMIPLQHKADARSNQKWHQRGTVKVSLSHRIIIR